MEYKELNVVEVGGAAGRQSVRGRTERKEPLIWGKFN